MTEQLISYETAKLAKEKGFNERGHYFYKVKSENDIELYGCTKKQLVTVKSYVRIYHKVRDYHTNKEKLNAKLYRCSAPTQSLLAKWLREKYDIEINITRMPPEAIKSSFNKGNKRIKKYNMWVSSLNGNPRIENPSLFFDHYGEAFEIGLQEALKLIK